MTDLPKCSWPTGVGAETLSFTIFPKDINWNNFGGLYIFAYCTGGTSWKAVYVGLTEDFSYRMPNHERWQEAVRLGATHGHTLVVTTQAAREDYERKLIQHLQHPLNDQLK